MAVVATATLLNSKLAGRLEWRFFAAMPGSSIEAGLTRKGVQADADPAGCALRSEQLSATAAARCWSVVCFL